MPSKRAAGVVVYRIAEGVPRYLLLRNAAHRTWGFPKGHLESGESDRDAAMRELAEETGIRGLPLRDDFRDEVSYPVATRSGPAHKTVVYFLGEAPHETAVRSGEHDALAWTTFDEALERLQHENLRAVLRRAHRVAAAGSPR